MSENDHLPAEVLLYETEFVDGESVMVYEHNEGWHSAAYTREGRHFDLVFNYTKRFNLIFEHLNEDAEILMIGGGAYSYPKYDHRHILLRSRDYKPLYFQKGIHHTIPLLFLYFLQGHSYRAFHPFPVAKSRSTHQNQHL
jgi:hypothetical protein